MKNSGKPTSLDIHLIHSTQEPFLSLSFIGLCQSVSQSVSAYGGGWVEVVDVDNLGVTVLSGVPSGTYMLAYMGKGRKILLKLQYPLIVS